MKVRSLLVGAIATVGLLACADSAKAQVFYYPGGSTYYSGYSPAYYGGGYYGGFNNFQTYGVATPRFSLGFSTGGYNSFYNNGYYGGYYPRYSNYYGGGLYNRGFYGGSGIYNRGFYGGGYRGGYRRW